MRQLGSLVTLAVLAAGVLELGCAPGDTERLDDAEQTGEATSALGQPLGSESEPNNAAAMATPITKDGVITASVFPVADVDLFSFNAVAGERVYAATATAFAAPAADTLMDLVGSDGTTVIETDNDNGALGASASSLA